MVQDFLARKEPRPPLGPMCTGYSKLRTRTTLGSYRVGLVLEEHQTTVGTERVVNFD